MIEFATFKLASFLWLNWLVFNIKESRVGFFEMMNFKDQKFKEGK